MGVVADLCLAIRERRPELAAVVSEDGRVLRIAEREGEADPGRPRFTVEEADGAVVLDGTWRVALRGEGGTSGILDFVLGYVSEAIENHGWEVPLVLEGGPRHGLRLTKHREDLVGRLLFTRAGVGPDEPAQADVYKWHLRRSAAGEYVCVYERSLVGEALDAFLARGVESTGPFVVIHGVS
jgi:hypothetical protein